MKRSDQTNVRWAEQGRSVDTLQQAAAELIRAIPEPKPLSPNAIARIRMQLELAELQNAQPVQHRVRAWLLLGIAVPAACAFVLGYKLNQYDRQTHQVASMSRPDELANPPAAPPVRTLKLGKGRIELRDQDAAVAVETPTARVLIPAGGGARIEVTDLRGTRVVGYAGQVEIEMNGQHTVLAPGERFGWGAPATVVPTEHETGRVTAQHAEIEHSTPERQAAPMHAQAADVPQGKLQAGNREVQEAKDDGVPAGDDHDLSGESHHLAQAVSALRQGRDPARALAEIATYQKLYPQGKLGDEAQVLKVEALLEVGQNDKALAELDHADLAGWPRGREFRVLRGELRAGAGRCGAALADFDATVFGDTTPVEERALFGRASCHAQSGGPAAAREDLDTYLSRFPNGKFAAAARKALGR
jgi:TolA-binding protein